MARTNSVDSDYLDSDYLDSEDDDPIGEVDMDGPFWHPLSIDAMAECLEKKVLVFIDQDDSVPGALRVAFQSPLPPAVRKSLNLGSEESKALQFRLEFGQDTLDGPAPPQVSFRTPGGGHWLDLSSMERHAGHAGNVAHAECRVYNLKALLSLIGLDLEVLWLGKHKKKPELVRDRVRGRVCPVAEQAQLEELRRREAAVDVEKTVDDIIRSSLDGPNSVKTLLGKLVMAIWHGMKKMPLRCFCCGAPHPTSSSDPVWKLPQACTNDLCRHTSVNSLRFAELLPAVKGRPQTVDLLLMLASSACHSTRVSSVFTPVPVDFIAGSGSAPDYGGIADHLRRVPPLAELLQCSSEGELLRRLSGTVPWKTGGEVAAGLRRADGDAQLGLRLYRLVWWVISNVSHSIEFVKETDVPKPILDRMPPKEPATLPAGASGFAEPSHSVATRLVFRVTSLDRAFKQHSRQGTIPAFHGSLQQNWYSIFKHGLANMSSSPTFMRNGAVHGNGAYFGRCYPTSKGYSLKGHQLTGALPAYVPPTERINSAASSSAAEAADAAALQARLDTHDRWRPTYFTSDFIAVGLYLLASSAETTAQEQRFQQSPNSAPFWVISNKEHIKLEYLVVENL